MMMNGGPMTTYFLVGRRAKIRLSRTLVSTMHPGQADDSAENDPHGW